MTDILTPSEPCDIAIGIPENYFGLCSINGPNYGHAVGDEWHDNGILMRAISVEPTVAANCTELVYSRCVRSQCRRCKNLAAKPAEAASAQLLSNISLVADGIAHEIYAIVSRPTATWTDDDYTVIRFALLALIRRRASIAALISELEAQVALTEQRNAVREKELADE